MLKRKKGDEIVSQELIFLVLNLLFFAILLFFVFRSGSGATIAEEAYAKKIALIIDNMKPGMEVNISLAGLYSIMSSNKFSEFPVHVENNTVTVRAMKGKGYSFRFFSNVSPLIIIDKTSKDKIMTIRT
jgi:uncharacterized protein (UPF0333 family)